MHVARPQSSTISSIDHPTAVTGLGAFAPSRPRGAGHRGIGIRAGGGGGGGGRCAGARGAGRVGAAGSGYSGGTGRSRGVGDGRIGVGAAGSRLGAFTACRCPMWHTTQWSPALPPAGADPHESHIMSITVGAPGTGPARGRGRACACARTWPWSMSHAWVAMPSGSCSASGAMRTSRTLAASAPDTLRPMSSSVTWSVGAFAHASMSSCSSEPPE